jgi:ribA/ribD-fused uncharacterized protein
MKYDVDWLRSSILDGRKHTYIGFWGDESDSPIEQTFSNFYRTDFHADGHAFECSEQYFMYQKAVFFHDSNIANRILEEGLPSIAYKKLGRKIKGYDDGAWSLVRYDAMLRALRMKYSQNDELRSYLVYTGDSILVETSPFDRVWGIHLGKKNRNGEVDRRWLDPMQWQGDNLLGFALMELRDDEDIRNLS